MLNKEVDSISFASKDFNPEIEKIEVSNNDKLMLNNTFNYIVNVHEELIGNHEKDVAKKLYTETHLVSIIPYVKRSMENNINESMFAEFLINFFKTENDSETYISYMEACSNGVARNPSIVTRHNALGKFYNNFFKTEEESLKDGLTNSLI
jgi:hypothetical protein